MPHRLQAVLALLRSAYEEWKRDNALMLAAAVSFYATFSLAPLLVLLLNAGAFVFGEHAARSRLLEFVDDAVGAKAARAVERLILAASKTDAGATAVSVVLLVLASSAVFRQLKIALNIVLDVPTKRDRGMLRFLKTRGFAALVAVIGIVLILSALGVTTALAWWRSNAPQAIEEAATVWRGVELGVSFTILIIVFGAILRFVPDIKVKWAHAGIGAALAALVFVGGQLLLSAYVAHARLTAAYGAAGSVVLLLVYVYFTVAVVLAAAELTEIFARGDLDFRDKRRRLQDVQNHKPRKA
jgi:membrane protein